MKKIIHMPFITEKTTALHGARRYAFVVSNSANKLEIKQAVEEMYKVHVMAINTLLVPRKRKKRYTSRQVVHGKKAGYKKAIVQVREGEVIDFYENV